MRRDRGAVAVEFALVLPVLLALVFGLIQYGLYFWSMQGGSSATREAARRAAVGNPAACSDFKDYVRARVGSTSSNASAAVITRSYKRLIAPATPTDAATWQSFTPNASNPVQVGDMVSVTLEFRGYDLNLPFVPFIDDAIVANSADARVEYVPDPTQTLACSA